MILQPKIAASKWKKVCCDGRFQGILPAFSGNITRSVMECQCFRRPICLFVYCSDTGTHMDMCIDMTSIQDIRTVTVTQKKTFDREIMRMLPSVIHCSHVSLLEGQLDPFCRVSSAKDEASDM